MEKEIAVFGGGCFWCTEAVFKLLRGVISVTPGYAGGAIPNPTYEAVSTGTTGYAEVSKVEFDPSEISYHDLLTVFFASHDPTSLNRQGADVGSQYRSVIFVGSESQKDQAVSYIRDLENADPGGKPIVTEIVPLVDFYPAENYHVDYYATHQDASYSEFVITPKVEKVQKQFDALLKSHAKN
jgi:peptide-methionine (S)-S-oxide reductase